MTAVVPAPPLSLADIQVHLQGCGLLTAFPGVIVKRGRVTDPQLLRAGVGRLVILSGGSGQMSPELTMDRPIVDIRSVGQQSRDEQAAEDDARALAYAIDGWLLGVVGTGMVGSARVHGISRSGGGPTHIDTDKSRRVHYQCGYVFPVASAQT